MTTTTSRIQKLIAVLTGAVVLVPTIGASSFVIEDLADTLQVSFNGSPISFQADPAWNESAIIPSADYHTYVPDWWRFNNTQYFVLLEADGTVSDWASATASGISFYSDHEGTILPMPALTGLDTVTVVPELAGGNTFDVMVPNLSGGHDVIYTLTLRSDVPDPGSTMLLASLGFLGLAGYRRFAGSKIDC